jgi:hypothetical protein
VPTRDMDSALDAGDRTRTAKVAEYKRALFMSNLDASMPWESHFYIYNDCSREGRVRDSAGRPCSPRYGYNLDRAVDSFASRYRKVRKKRDLFCAERSPSKSISNNLQSRTVPPRSQLEFRRRVFSCSGAEPSSIGFRQAPARQHEVFAMLAIHLASPRDDHAIYDTPRNGSRPGARWEPTTDRNLSHVSASAGTRDRWSPARYPCRVVAGKMAETGYFDRRTMS